MWLLASFVRFALVGQHHSSPCEGLGIHYPIQSSASVARQEQHRIQEPASILVNGTPTCWPSHAKLRFLVNVLVSLSWGWRPTKWKLQSHVSYITSAAMHSLRPSTHLPARYIHSHSSAHQVPYPRCTSSTSSSSP